MSGKPQASLILNFHIDNLRLWHPHIVALISIVEYVNSIVTSGASYLLFCSAYCKDTQDSK